MNIELILDEISNNFKEFVKTGKISRMPIEALYGEFYSLIKSKQFINKAKNSINLKITIIHVVDYLIDSLQNKDKRFIEIIEVIKTHYFTKDVVTCYTKHTENFLHKLFHSLFISNMQLSELAVDIFKLSDSYFKPNEFNVSKAFLCYFAYNLNDYSIVKDILYRQFIVLSKIVYDFHFDFQLMNYYKGIILISKEEFSEAALCFISGLNSSKQREISELSHTISFCQLQSVKRLVLLYPLVSTEIQSQVNKKLNNYDIHFSTLNLNFYVNLKGLNNNVNSDFPSYLKLLQNNKDFVISENILGLYEKILEKVLLNSIKTHIEVYYKLNLNDLSSIVNCEIKVLKKYLKKFFLKGELSFKIEESSNIIEFDFQPDNNFKITERLKEAYEKMNRLQLEIVDMKEETN